MSTVYVENRPYTMDAEQNLLHGCLSHGFDLPYFCWHPALGSVGACRQCAVKQFKDEHDSHGKLVMACVTPASEGARISIRDPEAAAFRKSIIEGLMLNHPHDCPVCDEGGECHLQDMTVMTGHDYRRYRFQKRTFRNQDLGPFVNHEMNRCIQCYRCVRYYREFAGGSDLNVFSIRNTVYFGRENDGPLENEFAGNLVEICPTGVFTDKTLYRHYTRKWDQMFAPSICVHCGVGCNTDVGERYGTVRRVMNRYHHEINGYFLCDRGRFGYEFVNHPERIRQPLLNARPVDAAFARGYLHDAVKRGRTIGIGSPRASLETNFALRQLVGPENFYSGLAGNESRILALILTVMRAIRAPTLQEIEQSDAILILGEDLTNYAPRVALSVRQAVRQRQFEIARKLKIPLWQDHGVRDAAQNARSPLILATPYATKLDDIATAIHRAAPEEIAAQAESIAAPLAEAKRPVVISGAGLNSEAVIQTAARIAAAHNAPLYLAAPECNSVGAALLAGKPLRAIAPEIDTVIVAENDLSRRAINLNPKLRVIALDFLPTPTTARAELVLPAATFAESESTFINNEARAQRFFRALPPAGDVRESWRWLGDWRDLDEILRTIAAEFSPLEPILRAAPSARFRIDGAKIPRASHRYSGRTAIDANIHISEPKPPADPDSPLNFSMEGASPQPPPALIPFFWSPGWNSIQSTNFYQREVGGPLRGPASGARVLAPSEPLRISAAPQPEPLAPGEYLLLPEYRIFGSEELSRWSRGVAQLTPAPHVAVRETSIPEGSEVILQVANAKFRTTLRHRPELPPGVATVTAGMAPFAGLTLPVRCRILPV